MNKSEGDSVQNSLGEAIQQLNESENEKGEKARIYSLLIKEDSEASRRTKQWCLLNKKFEKYSTKMAGKIHGFRPKTRQFKLKAYSLLVQSMARDNRYIGWVFYEEAYIDFLRKEKVELTRLLELEESEGKTAPDELIKAVIEKSPKYNVTASDIKDLYENWYFKRNNEFEQWILGLKGIGRSLENKRHIKEIELEIASFRNEVSSVNKNMVSNNEFKGSIKSLNKLVQTRQDEMTEELKKLRFEFKNQIKISKEKSENISRIQSETKTFKGELNKLKSNLDILNSDSIGNLENKIKILEKKYENKLNEFILDLEQKIQATEINNSTEPAVSQFSSDFKVKNRVIHKAGKNTVEIHVEEEQFLVDFGNVLASSEPKLANKLLTLNHCILKCSDVICCQSLAIVDPWIRTLNWEKHVFEAAVDPNWTNYSVWQDVASAFLSNPNIRILILHSYNCGYVEGYLKPFLLLFRREHYPNKKIILVETNQTSKDAPAGVGVRLIENEKSNKLKIPNETVESTESVALKSFNEWTAINDDEAEDYANDICQELAEFAANENINIHEADLLGLYRALCAYIYSGLALDQNVKNTLLTQFMSSHWEKDIINKFFQDI